MKPRLNAAAGTLQGRTFEIPEQGLSLGRDAACDVQISDREVSRRHCEIRRKDDSFLLRDLGSRHGTFVNGCKVDEHVLRHTDALDLGSSRFVFLLDDSTADARRDSDDEARNLSQTQTLERKLTESRLLQSDLAPDAGRLARDLHVLARLSAALQEAPRLEDLAERLLDACRDSLSADRAAVLFREPGVERPRALAQDGDPRLSRTVLDRVLVEGIALLCPDAASDDELGAADSLENIGAVLAAPLLDRDGEALGAICLDRDRRGFSEHHLELLTAFAAVASLAVQNALHLRWLESENERLRGEAAAPRNMIGQSPIMRRVFDLVERVARADSTVLIQGESGSGKELIAQAVHRASPRTSGPFVAVNCAALNENLLESELFGHERGAFTGAQARKIGKMEIAQRGTLFLDEIAEIPLALQAKLLRALQEREIERVGGERPIKIDVRVVSATHRNLAEAVREGNFREDLYYRLNVIPIELPPLRDRREDIPLLASFFVKKHGARMGWGEIAVAPEARQALLAWSWPGNVRELSNAIERAVVLGDGEVLRREDLPEEIAGATTVAAPLETEEGADFQSALTAYKKVLILDAWRAADGDYSETARRLGVHVNSLHRMVRQLELKEALKDVATR